MSERTNNLEPGGEGETLESRAYDIAHWIATEARVAESLGRSVAPIESEGARRIVALASALPTPAASEDVRERVVWLLSQWVDELEMHWEDPEDDVEPAGVGQIADEILALLRTPRGEGAGVVAAASAYLRALDTYRKECQDREIPLAEYAYDEFRRLAEPLTEAEERLRAALRSEAQGEDELVETVIRMWEMNRERGYRYTEGPDFYGDLDRAYELAAARRGEGGGE